MKPGTITFQTGEMLIGKHRWRCLVYAHPQYGACTRYQWYDDLNYRNWVAEDRWPRYNTHDSYNGLPKTLERLYRAYEIEIHKALIAGKLSWLADHDRAKDAWGWDSVNKSLAEDRVRLDRLQTTNRLVTV